MPTAVAEMGVPFSPIPVAETGVSGSLPGNRTAGETVPPPMVPAMMRAPRPPPHGIGGPAPLVVAFHRDHPGPAPEPTLGTTPLPDLSLIAITLSLDDCGRLLTTSVVDDDLEPRPHGVRGSSPLAPVEDLLGSTERDDATGRVNE